MYLNKKNKFGNPLSKFVGVYLPLRITNAVILNCLAFEISKTCFIETLLNEWIESYWTKEKQTEGIHLIATRLKINFDTLAKTQRSLTYGMYVSESKTELLNKGLTPDIIEKILTQFQKIHFNK